VIILLINFFSYFVNSFICNNTERAESLRKEFFDKYSNYCGFSITDGDRINTELVSTIIGNFKQPRTLMFYLQSIYFVIHSFQLSWVSYFK